MDHPIFDQSFRKIRSEDIVFHNSCIDIVFHGIERKIPCFKIYLPKDIGCLPESYPQPLITLPKFFFGFDQLRNICRNLKDHRHAAIGKFCTYSLYPPPSPILSISREILWTWVITDPFAASKSI